MAIWSAEIKELEKLNESLKGQLPELEKELERLVKADDENMILLYSRRCLEVIITDLCECELKRERGTEPLKGIIDKLNKEKKVPPHIISSMNGLNELSTYGTHPKDFDPEQVKPVLNNLLIAIKWYQKYRETNEISLKLSEAVNIKDYDLNKNWQIEKKVIPRKRTYKRLKNRILIGVLVIIALLTLIIFYRTFFADGAGSYTRSEEILDKGIKFHDFLNRWDNYQGEVHLTTLFANQNDPSNEIIEIKTKEGYWKCTRISANSKYVLGIKDGNCFKEIDSTLYEGNDQIKENECSDMQFYRGHHYLHFGTLMEIKRSGLILERKVKTAKFQGLKCLKLVFQNDTSKTRNMYFKRAGAVKINVYLDPQNHSMKGYKLTGSYDFYVVFSGFLNINGITMPKCKASYNNSDNSFIWVDLFSATE